MKTFSEYCKEQDVKELSQWLESQGYDPKTLDLEAILEEGWKDSLKDWGKKAVIAGALAGGAYGMFGKGGADAPDAPSKQPQTQSQSGPERLLGPVKAKEIQQKRERNQQIIDQLKKAGRTSGTIKKGVLQDDKQSQDDGSKTIVSSSVTSSAARKYFK